MGDGDPPCSCEAVGPCTKRDSPQRSAELFVRSLWKLEGRAKDLNGLAGLRVGGGDGDPPCSCKAVGPCTKRDSPGRSAKLFGTFIWKHEGRAEDLKGLPGLRVGTILLALLRWWGPRTTRDSPPRSAEVIKRIQYTPERRSEDPKRFHGLRVGVGDGDPPCSLKALYLRRFFDLLVPKAIQGNLRT